MENKDFYVVAIGASAGGLDAIQQLFDHLPNNTGVAFVVIQHLSPDFISLMPELLAKHTSMKIYTAEDKQEIKPNCIYLNQRNKNLHIKGNKLYLLDKGPKNNLNLPIDIFFHTVGEEFKEKSIGIILSGTGSDGSRGIKTIKEAGGIIIAQDPTTAQFDGMPNTAIGTNLCDFILPIEKIAEVISKIPGQRILLNTEVDSKQSNDVIFNKILEEIHKSSGIDFRQYKKNTLIRRLEKRMNINNIELLYDYHVYLKSNPKEKEMLKQDFLIGVTSFFRDIEAFESLKKSIIPNLFKSQNSKDPIRVWIPGCSTGEEVFSIAILIDDYMRNNKINQDFKIFATDVDSTALATAGQGSFHINVSNEIESYYLEKYFVKAGDKLLIHKRIREKIVFSNHNLLKDPPFIRMNLICCRNLLIYLDSRTQRKVILNFQFALNKYGYLFLGNSESLGEIDKFFKVIDSKWKIFQNVSDTKLIPTQTTPDDKVTTISYRNPVRDIQNPEYRFKENPENVFHRYLSKKFSPSSIFIDSEFNILFIKGDAGKKLMHSEGLFQNNLLKMVSTEIATVIRNGIRRLEIENKDILVKDVAFKQNNNVYTFDLSFHRPKQEEEDLSGVYLVHFSEDRVFNSDVYVIENVPIDKFSKQRLEDLESELKGTKAELQNVVEELETSNEELQSSNEELMASNEELQSTNEELQSVNEELYTVNAELQEKNKQLEIVNNDITNLLNSTEIGTLFLDANLRIRKYTPALQRIFNLEDTDIGRPITSFASNFSDTVRELITNKSELVLKKLSSVEEEIMDRDGNHSLMRIIPFITIDKKIDGVVITFVDITKVKEAEINLTKSENLFKSIFTNAGIGIATVSTNRKPISVNPELENIIGYTNDEISKMSFEEFTHPEDVEIDVVQYKKLIEGKIDWYRMDKRYIHKNGYVIWGQLTVTVVRDVNNEVLYSVALVKDITEHKEIENKLNLEKQFNERIAETSPNGIYIYDIKKGTNIFTNKRYKEILGYDINEINAMSQSQFTTLFHPDDHQAIDLHMKEVIEGKENSKIEYRFKHKQGHWVWCYSIDCPFEVDEKGEVVSFIGSFIDLSEKKDFEEMLKQAKQKAEIANIYKNQFLANMSHEIRTPINGIVGFADLLKEKNLSIEKRNKYSEVIKSSSNQLLILINDIIDISKIEAGELKLLKKPCHLGELIQDLETTFIGIKNQKQKEHLKIITEIPKKHANLTIETDPFRLHQVLSNLINNAIKFSDEGTIKFGFNLENNIVKFYVKDEGIGIPQEKINLIFNRFEQLSYGDLAKNEGTGLGLTISKGIIDLLNGKLNIISSENKGTMVTVELPYIKTDVLPSNLEQINIKNYQQTLSGSTVLVAEDVLINREYFKELLNSCGCNTLFVENGKEAVKVYFENPDIDIVLMDIRLPIMSGIKAAKQILKKDPNAKIIAQTAYAMESDYDKFLDLGFIDYLSKPIIKEQLLNKIAIHVNAK
ncbi:chemotaxis protein CheB [Ochrovirga pacifica]|uniref:chemotaxis protein CheB n=1 Tax=Ochrovirga pacifica TaxID=1042376 RepID=UPI000255A512|nr:chemotaxis protein CheB [Ochrovirga pacifica]